MSELVVTPHPAFEMGAAMYAPVLQALHGDQRVLTTFAGRVTVRL